MPLKDYRILHFAAHALLPTDLRCQTEAAIVTSPPAGARDASGALLTASKVLGLDLDANLVILSACNSGGPGGGAGESLSGLARSFFFAKARSLLVTHWEVSDQVAALLVVLTINDMKEKPVQGVTGALREAQLSLLDRAASGEAAGGDRPSVLLGSVRRDRRRRGRWRSERWPRHAFIPAVEGLTIRCYILGSSGIHGAARSDTEGSAEPEPREGA